MIGAVENTTAPETAKLCEQYLGPGVATAQLQQPAVSDQPVPAACDQAGQTSSTPIRSWRREARGRAIRPSRRPRCRPTPASEISRRPPVTAAPACRHAAGPVRATTKRAATPSPALFPRAPIPGPPNIAPGPGAVGSGHAASADPGAAAPPQAPLLPAEGSRHHDPPESREGDWSSSGRCVALTMTGCAFQGLNSLPLPGAVGRGPDAVDYTSRSPNVATLESNSPVMINDVVVGSVGKMTVDELARQRRDLGQARRRRTGERRAPRWGRPACWVRCIWRSIRRWAKSRAVDCNPVPPSRLNQSSTYPIHRADAVVAVDRSSTAGGLGQIGDIIHNFSAAVSRTRARDPRAAHPARQFRRDVLDAQRDNIIASIKQLNRVAGTFAGQRDVIDRALKEIPPALDVLIKERPHADRPRCTKLGTFSDTATRLVNDAGDDLVKNLKNLEPALKALADIGPDLSTRSSSRRRSRTARASPTRSPRVTTST